MSFTVRQVKKSEIEKVYELEKNIFQPINYPQFVLKQFYDLMPELFLVAVNEHDEIIGYTQGGINFAKKEGWILSLATKKSERGRGIGRKLSERVIELLKTKRANSIYLTVHPDNLPAVELYQKLSFKSHEKVMNYYGDGEPRLVMRLEELD